MKKFKSMFRLISILIGQGAFGITMVATYQSAAVFIKQIKSYSPYVSDIFRKEALVLSQIKHENIIRLLGVCDDPVSIMTGYCYFSLKPFQCNEQFNSLDHLIHWIINLIHLSMQTSYLQKIKEEFHKAVSFVPEERKTVHCLKSLLENQAHVLSYPYLSPSLPH